MRRHAHSDGGLRGASTTSTPRAPTCASSAAPCVVKADGLAAGKGVVVCDGPADAERALARDDGRAPLRRRGRARRDRGAPRRRGGLATTRSRDGERVVPLAAAQDHKRALRRRSRRNTGGMGAYSPVPIVTPELEKRVLEEVVASRPSAAWRAEGHPFRGVLFVGLMIDAAGTPQVIEFNVRFGDPETQVLMLRLDGDLVPLLDGAARGRLQGVAAPAWHGAAVCVVLASGGYPRDYATGKPITGVEAAERDPDVLVFHAGTQRDADRRLVTRRRARARRHRARRRRRRSAAPRLRRLRADRVRRHAAAPRHRGARSRRVKSGGAVARRDALEEAVARIARGRARRVPDRDALGARRRRALRSGGRARCGPGSSAATISRSRCSSPACTRCRRSGSASGASRRELADTFWPGPLTMVLPCSGGRFAAGVTGPGGGARRALLAAPGRGVAGAARSKRRASARSPRPRSTATPRRRRAIAREAIARCAEGGPDTPLLLPRRRARRRRRARQHRRRSHRRAADVSALGRARPRLPDAAAAGGRWNDRHPCLPRAALRPGPRRPRSRDRAALRRDRAR